MPLSAYERGYRFGQRLRNTVFLTVLTWFVAAGSAFWWHPEVFAFLLAPAGEMLSPFDGKPVISAAQDGFGGTIGLAGKVGQVAAFPVVAVGALSMLKPFVPSRFWLFFTTYSFLAVALFVAGAVFVYLVMMPVSMHFLLNFGKDIWVPVITLSAYMELLLALLFWMGVAFELPLIMNLLAKFRVFMYPRAMNYRKWAVPTVFIFAAIITPSLDGTLTFMVAVPMLLLFEIGLIAGWLEHPGEGNYPNDLYQDVKALSIIIVIAVLGMAIGVIGLVTRLLGINWAYRKVRGFLVRNGLVGWW